MRWAVKTHTFLLLASASLLIALVYAPASATAKAPVRPATSGRVSDPDAKVLVKLRRGACDWKTGQVAPEALERIKRRASKEGLAYVRALRPRCWHLFEAANTQQATAAAIAALTPAEPGAAIAADAKGTLDVSQPFAIAGQDVPKRLLITKPEPTPNIAASRRQRRRRHIKDPATATAAAAPDGVVKPAAYPEECPNGECPAMWNMNYINIPDIWDTSVPVNRVTVKATLIDTGVDFTHNDLKDQVDQENSATFNPAGNVPEGGWADRGVELECMSLHGTHVTGTVAGGWGNGDTRGIAGIVGPAQSSIVICNCFSISASDLPCTATGAQVTYTDEAVSDCLAHSSDVNSNQIINLSIGALYKANDPSLQLQRDAIQQFVCDSGGIVVAAAGNREIDISSAGVTSDGFQYDGMWPANFASEFPDCVLAVAASDRGGVMAEFSNFGAAVLLAAPGTEILSDSLTYFNNNTANTNLWRSISLAGTSMSAPHVTGTIHLLRNLFPTATSATILRCLVSTATQKLKPPAKDADRTIGGGMLNPVAAYQCVSTAVNGESPSPRPPSPRPPRPQPGRRYCPTSGLPLCVNATTGVIVDRSACTAGSYCHRMTATPRGLETVIVGFRPDSWRCRYDLLPSGTICYPSTPCFSGSRCDGASPNCPAGSFTPEGTVCMAQPSNNMMGTTSGDRNRAVDIVLSDTDATPPNWDTIRSSFEIYCRQKSSTGASSNAGAVQSYLSNMQAQIPECTDNTNAAAAAAYRRQRRQKAAAAAAAGDQKTSTTIRSRRGYWNNNRYGSQTFHPPTTGFNMPTGQPLYECGRCHAGHCMEVGQWRCFGVND